MNNIFSFINFYIFIWICYILQGALGLSGIVSKGLLALILIISIYYFFKVNSLIKRKPIVFQGINKLLLMFTIYGIILIIIGGNTKEVASYEYLKAVYMSFMPLYVIYYFSYLGKINLNILKYWLPILLLVTTIEYFHFEYVTVLETIKDEGEITNNTVYKFVALLPAIVVLKKLPSCQYLFIIYILVFLFLGVKRGAIFIAVISLIWYFYISFKEATKKEIIYMMIFFIILVIGGFYILQIVMEDNIYFMKRVEDTIEGNTSGRDSLYGVFWNFYINQDNIFGFLFGHGGDYTWVVGGNLAHNDWLEILVNNGLIGILLFMYFWYTLYKTWKTTNNTEAYICIGLFLIIYFMKTLFSMSYSSISFSSVLYLGYYLAHRKDHFIAN